MSLSETQIKKMARLTFREPYTFSQLAKLIKSTHREVYDFFRTKKSKDFFVTGRPYIEVLEPANQEISKGKRLFYKKLVRVPDILVRLSPNGLDLIAAEANLKLRVCKEKTPHNRQRIRALKAKAEKQIFKKLNYSHKVLTGLSAGQLEPSDLPFGGAPGSSKYYSLTYPDKRSEGSSFPADKPVPSSWLTSSMMDSFKEDAVKLNYYDFGVPGLEEEDLIDLPYSQDRLIEQFSKYCQKKYDPFKIGRASPERYQAVMKLLRSNLKNFGFTIDTKDDKGNRIFIPTHEDIKEECIELFEDYKERTSLESLILMPKKDKFFGEPILKANANRFNDEDKKASARIRFENLFSDAGRKYKSAIMLTLTSGQWHNNIFEDVKKFKENFNKLITRLRKEAKDKRIKKLIQKNPNFIKQRICKNLTEVPAVFRNNVSDFKAFESFRNEQKIQNKKSIEFRNAAKEYIKNDQNLKMPYLCVREFQKNGNVHYHIIIFGITLLERNDEIESIWREYGQGQITKINKIKFNETRGYVWDRNSVPKDAGGRQPLEYLKKYLLKGQYSTEEGLLYWVFNSRFFTYSSSILNDEHRPRPYKSKNLYEFAGVCMGGFWFDNGNILMCVDTAG